ncbi:MAG: SAM-dependent methyltransferase, partial [Lachnospiraceae bacterium]|nr:SAM-dependent methyltransferase [Lachnospiraceae bacterium]
HTHSSLKELYEYVRLEDINRINDMAGVTRQQIISADGPADYMRRELNAMDDETYERFIEYHLKTCERPELLGAGDHTLDILQT